MKLKIGIGAILLSTISLIIGMNFTIETISKKTPAVLLIEGQEDVAIGAGDDLDI